MQKSSNITEFAKVTFFFHETSHIDTVYFDIEHMSHAQSTYCIIIFYVSKAEIKRYEYMDILDTLKFRFVCLS